MLTWLNSQYITDGRITNLEEHMFAATSDFSLPTEEGLIKSPGKCVDCLVNMVRVFDLTTDDIVYFVESK